MGFRGRTGSLSEGFLEGILAGFSEGILGRLLGLLEGTLTTESRFFGEHNPSRVRMRDKPSPLPKCLFGSKHLGGCTNTMKTMSAIPKAQ